MAHFAKLDENNIVLEVHCVSNAALNPQKEEESGIEFLTQWSGGFTNWKQCSYNGNFRKNYPGKGYFYDEMLDAFIPPKPYDSWILDETICRWVAPIAVPDLENSWLWDETRGCWIER